jgi:hypothetical protein
MPRGEADDENTTQGVSLWQKYVKSARIVREDRKA